MSFKTVVRFIQYLSLLLVLRSNGVLSDIQTLHREEVWKKKEVATKF